MKLLSDYDSVRANNFTAIRLLFAWLVLFGHSFPITGNGSDPISMFMLPHTWIGAVAVSGFFTISGFLVTASFAQRGAANFVASRILRLYPAVIIYCAVAIVVIGPLAVHVDLRTYFATERWDYMRNALLWSFNRNLPFAFAENPLAGSANGATWTLPGELRCYTLVLGIGLCGALKTRMRANVALGILLFITVDVYHYLPLFEGESRFVEPLLFFVVGSLAWINRCDVPLTWPIALIAVAAPFLVVGNSYSLPVYAVSLSYAVLFAVYRLPHIDLDRFGDISYGVYIYAWPIQQLVWTKGQSAYTNALLATLIVAPIALLSWKLIEFPALKLRRLLSARRRTEPRTSGQCVPSRHDRVTKPLPK